MIAFLYSSDLYVVLTFVGFRHLKVVTTGFHTVARWVAFVKAENLVIGTQRPHLESGILRLIGLRV